MRVFYFRLRRGVTTCVLMDCHKEDCQEDIYSDVQATPGSSQDSRCLLDAICGAPTSPWVSSDYMFLKAGEGYVPVRIRLMHSCTPWPFISVIWWCRRYVGALLRPSGASRWHMCCVRSVCAWLHRLVLRDITSIHDCATDIRSSSRCICDAAQTYPSNARVTYPSKANTSIHTCRF